MNKSENKNFDFSTLWEMLETNAERFPTRQAFALKSKSGEICKKSYKQFYDEAKSLAASLSGELGLSGKKIAICMKNCYEWCLSYFAVLSGIGVAVPLEKEMPADDLAGVIEFAQISAVIADSKTASRILEKSDRLPKDFIIITTDFCGDNRTTDFGMLLSKGKDMLENGSADLNSISPDPDALSVLLFTSGTTGLAKGVMLSNRNILSDLVGVSKICYLDMYDSTLCTLPLHHTYQTIVMLMMLYLGGSVSFCENLRHIFEDLAFFKPTILASVPLLLEKTHAKIMGTLAEQVGGEKAITSGHFSSFVSALPDEARKAVFNKIRSHFGGRLRMIITGAAAIDEDIAKDYSDFGFLFIIGYGLTECSPIAICNSSSDPRTNSIGIPIDKASIKIENIGEDGIGEICVKGPMVMKGYYNAKEETEKVLKNGWLHTGDLGYEDDEGFYHITGRSKNVIVTKNGKNIYPEEIEYCLNREPVIIESFVFSSQDENEIVCAAVLPDEEAIKAEIRKNNLTKEDIHRSVEKAIRKINASLPSYKRIRKFHIRNDEFEKTSTSKIKRNSQSNRSGDEEIM